LSRGIPLQSLVYFRGMPLELRASHKVEVLRICERSLPADRFTWSLDLLVWPRDGGGGSPQGRFGGVMRFTTEKNKKEQKRDLPLDNRAKPRYTVLRGDKT
jgi:hypothetical protein